MKSLRQAKAELIAKLQELEVPELSEHANTDEISAVRGYFDNFVAAIDWHILAIGDAVKERTRAHIDLMQFTHILRDATDGFGRFEFDCAVEELRVLAAEAA